MGTIKVEPWKYKHSRPASIVLEYVIKVLDQLTGCSCYKGGENSENIRMLWPL